MSASTLAGSRSSTAPARLHSGLRLQIVLALAGLMVLAFVPLFFAVASLTRATIFGAREQAARLLGRSIAEHVADVADVAEQNALRGTADETFGGPPRGRLSSQLQRTLSEHVGRNGVDAVCAWAREKATVECYGPPTYVTEMVALSKGTPESSVQTVRGATGRSLQVVTVAGGWTVITRTNIDSEGGREPPLVRLVALYMVVFALALLVFAYFWLTRLIVRPVEHLVDAADRVASGARTLRVPRSRARELVDLAASVQAMAEKLISEEAALILKVEELTETTRRLTDTRAQLVRSERMASVGRLAAGLAHEIGNPIAALMGMADLLLGGDLDAEAQRDFLQRMRKETERIHLVVRDLLDFARPEGQSELERTPQAPADVADVIDDVVALVRPQKLFRALRVEVPPRAGIAVTLPAAKLTQVLLNLVLNAAAAIVGAQGAQRAQREEGRIVIRVASDGAAGVRIEVEDDGPGVSPEVSDRLFEPFVTTKPVGQGTGLGLAVCRGLVESAGGEIGVDSSYVGGARFYVLLPAPG